MLFLRGFVDDEILTRAAALAYYAALSFAPILIVLIWTASFLGAEYQDRLVNALAEVLGSKVATAIYLIIESAEQRPETGSIAGWFSIGVTLFGASALFGQLNESLNRIWAVSPKPKKQIFAWLRSRLNALGLIISLGFLLMVSFGASAAVRVFFSDGNYVWLLVEHLVSLLLFSAIFAAIFKVLPDAEIGWRNTLFGAVTTALLFVLGKYFIALYIERSDVGGPYGPAGSIVVLLVWVYYASIIVLLGAELTQAVATARGASIKPSSHAITLEDDESQQPAAPKAVEQPHNNPPDR